MYWSIFLNIHSSWVVLFCFEIGDYTAQSSCELTTQLNLPLNSWSSGIHLLSAENGGKHHLLGSEEAFLKRMYNAIFIHSSMFKLKESELQSTPQIHLPNTEIQAPKSNSVGLSKQTVSANTRFPGSSELALSLLTLLPLSMAPSVQLSPGMLYIPYSGPPQQVTSPSANSQGAERTVHLKAIEWNLQFKVRAVTLSLWKVDAED